jgi:hypothetical protein
MELRLRVEASGHTHHVIANPWVIMLWERRMKTKVSKVMSDGLGLEDMAFMAYEALKAKGVEVPATFDLFAMTISSLEVEEDEAHPTEAALSAESSPKSPPKQE